MKKIDRTTKLKIYTTMVRIRLFEDRVVDLYARGRIPGLAHLYVGEEAIAAGACAAIRENDYITSTHRGHGHVIAKGADLKLMMAELFGKKTGYCKGKGGSMHIADMNLGILGANGIAGGGLPIAAGAGMSAKLRGTGQVTLCFFGDGSSNNGTFHESLNLASIYKLPVIFICENNGFGISLCQEKHQAIVDISVRAAGYNLPGVTVDGNNALEVYGAVSEAVKRACAKQGSTLIECKTYRWRGHHEGDPNQGERYRKREEIEQWKKKDPIRRLASQMIEERIVTKKALATIEQEAKEEIDLAVAFADESEFPAIEEIYEDVFTGKGDAQ